MYAGKVRVCGFLNDVTFCSGPRLCGFNIQREDYGYFVHNVFSGVHNKSHSGTVNMHFVVAKGA